MSIQWVELHIGAEKVIVSHSFNGLDNVGMIVDPELSICHVGDWLFASIQVLTIFRYEEEPAIEDVVVYPVDDPLSRRSTGMTRIGRLSLSC